MSDEIVVTGLEETGANLNRFVEVLEEELALAIAKCVSFVMRDARASGAFHDHSSHLRNSIGGDGVAEIIARIAAGVVEGRVWAGMEYGPFVEFGTGPSGAATNKNPAGGPYSPEKILRPVNAKALHWTDGAGGQHFARQVRWRGAPAHPYLVPAAEKNFDTILSELTAAIERAKARCAIA